MDLYSARRDPDPRWANVFACVKELPSNEPGRRAFEFYLEVDGYYVNSYHTYLCRTTGFGNQHKRLFNILINRMDKFLKREEDGLTHDGSYDAVVRRHRQGYI